MLNAKSSRQIHRTQQEYKIRDREVKRSERKDKRNFIKTLASEAEEAAEKRDFGTVYKITKQLCGNNTNHSMPVKDKQGKVITTEREQAARWVQHFEEVFNRPDPEEPADPPPSESYLDIDTSPPGIAEVRLAIESMKNGKAPGIDSLQAELFKADISTTSRLLTDLFSKIWEEEVIPNDWTKGLIFTLPKKGDLGNCDNWRGITLLSVPSKIFCRILLKRIEKAIDSTLREEQAGFRRGRGCMDQIFALRNILEQSLEWNTSLCINFIDFQKAFDSVHRESLWKILQAYGLPPKIINLIKMFYNNFECSIILGNTITEAFPVKSGVRQGCILSPILFLVTIDWVMRQATSLRSRGIQWTIFSHLQDLDFADDIAILSSTPTHLQEKTDDLHINAKKTGLIISKKKSKIMCVNSDASRPINIDGEPLEHIEEFTYLGSVISTDNSAQKDIKARLNKARCAFSRLKNIWKSKQYSLKTKVRIYNSNVKSVLLYGSECWRIVKRDINKVNAFHNSCLRRICNIFWPNKISNNDLYQKTGCTSIDLEIKKRRLRWLGHVLRMSPERIPKVALRWTPAGKRKRGRPKTTWRKTVESDLSEMGLSWGEAQAIAKDKTFSFEWLSIEERCHQSLLFQRTYSHGSGGPHIGDVNFIGPHIGDVTNLSIQSLFLT